MKASALWITTVGRTLSCLLSSRYLRTAVFDHERSVFFRSRCESNKVKETLRIEKTVGNRPEIPEYAANIVAKSTKNYGGHRKDVLK